MARAGRGGSIQYGSSKYGHADAREASGLRYVMDVWMRSGDGTSQIVARPSPKAVL